MRQNKSLLLGLILGLLSLQTGMFAETHYKFIQSPDADVYFGHISYLDVPEGAEMPFIQREGKEAPEEAVLNSPLAPGDTLITPEGSRCEIQFDTGTVIRLDSGTEVKIETILAPSLSSSLNLTNLILKKGQVYAMYKQYGDSEVLQMIVPNASIKLSHNTRLMIRANADGSTDLQVSGGQAFVLFGKNAQSVEQMRVNRSMPVKVTPSSNLEKAEYTNSADFYLWNENVNRNYDRLHGEITSLPKPVRRLLPAIFNFAQKFSNAYGEWIWNDIYGYVWRPFTNDYYPTGTWQPYYYGRWREINGSLFWVPQEAWGWIPYHLGNWIWNKRLGWVWLPGSVFAPAWVDWSFYFSRFSWRPLGLIEAYFIGPYCFYCRMADYAYLKEQLEQKLPPDVDESLFNDEGSLSEMNSWFLSIGGGPGGKKIKVPREIRIVLSRLAEAVQNGSLNILSSIDEMRGTVVVHAENLNRAQVHTFFEPFEKLDKNIQEGLRVRSREDGSIRSAVSAFRKDGAIAVDGGNPVLPESRAGNKESSGGMENLEQYLLANPDSRFDGAVDNVSSSEMRFRDWNPDVREALRIGVAIGYSSRDNAVLCPDLGLSSLGKNAWPGRISRDAFSTGASSSITRSGSGSSPVPSLLSGTSAASTSSGRSSSDEESRSSSGRTGSGLSGGGRVIKK